MITVYDKLETACSDSDGLSPLDGGLLSNLEADWRRLYAISPDVTPYQSYDYVRAALALCDGTPHIIAWQRKGAGPVARRKGADSAPAGPAAATAAPCAPSGRAAQAIFPCWIDRRGTLRFVADAHTDFCGPLVDPSCAGDYHMCEELAEHILSTPQIRRVRLENIRSRLFQSGLQYHLKGCVLFAYRKYSVMRVPAMASPESHASEKASLKDSASAQASGSQSSKAAIDALSHLSTKEKYRLKNIASKMDAAGVEFRLYAAPAGCDPSPAQGLGAPAGTDPSPAQSLGSPAGSGLALSASPWPSELIGTLTRSMIEAGIRKPGYFSPCFLDFLKAVYDAGLMVIAATWRGDTPLACNLLLRTEAPAIIPFAQPLAPGGAQPLASAFSPDGAHPIAPAFSPDGAHPISPAFSPDGAQRGEHLGELIDWIAMYDDPVSNGWNLLQCIRWMSSQGGGALNFARGVYMYKMHNYRPALHDLDRLRWSRSWSAGR